MKGKKIKIYSEILDSEFHIDEFSSKAKPNGVIIWFSPIKSKEKYRQSGEKVVNVFNEVWDQLKQKFKQNLSFIFLYVPGPYYIKYPKKTSEKKKWIKFVKEDILSRYPNLPFYLIGNSGGAALALKGVHKQSNIIGAGCIGGDDIPADLEIPLNVNREQKWNLDLHYNINDPVKSKNKTAIDILERKGYAYVMSYKGRHETEDYISKGAFDELIRSAINFG